MTKPFRTYGIAVTIVTLACFSAGYVSSGGAYTLERHRAISQAHAAARDVDVKRQALEDSLKNAQIVIDDAAGVADDARVRDAAKTLTAATVDALNVASANDVAVAAEPITLPQATSTDTPDEHAPITASGPTNLDTTTEVLPSVDVDVAEIDAARDATAEMHETGEALDAALAQVEATTASVEKAAELADMADDLEAITTAVALVPASTQRANDALTEIGLRVADSSVLAAVRTAVDALAGAASASQQIDRDNPVAVSTSLASLTGYEAGLAQAIDAAYQAHQSWIETENTRRTAINNQRIEEHETAVDEAREAYTKANRDFAAQRSNGWAGKPTTIVGTNGRLASSSLCAVSFAPGHRLQCDAAHALEDADAAYHADSGKHLVMTDSYRSYGLQVRTRAIKGRMAAVAGTSNHGWGMAIDLDSTSAAWLSANGPQFGWVHPDWASTGGSKPESWHLEYVAPEIGGFTAPDAPELLDLIDDELTQD